MRVAYLGLAYHRRTGSTRFLLELLERHAKVDVFFAEPDLPKLREACAGFDERDYDAIVVLQLHEAFALLSGRHPNVTYAPMYDAMWRGGAFIWKPSFNRAKVLCFSRALHAEVMRRAPVHAAVQYFPDPAALPPADPAPGLRGLLWYRRREIPPAAAFALTEGTVFDRLTIHDAPDPGHEAPFPDTVPPHLRDLRRTVWSPDGSSFAEAQASANVFFAPRPLEGIGMSFLEAMARGLCVVAPDAPTMNEYVSHGVNGLLYAPGRPAPRDFSRAREIGARARDDMAAGRARWEATLPALTDFLLTPTARIAARGASMPPALAPPAPPAAAGIARLEPGDAADAAADWVVLAPPGAVLDDAALSRAVAAAPPGTDIIRGHHLARRADGGAWLHRADDPAAAWDRLLAGEAGPEGLGVPEATLLRRSFRATPPASAPALAELLLEGAAACHVADEILATRPDPGTAERAGWIDLAARRAGAEGAERLTAAFAARDAAEEARIAAAAPARRALDIVGLADGVSPALGRFAERIVYSRRLRALIGR